MLRWKVSLGASVLASVLVLAPVGRTRLLMVWIALSFWLYIPFWNPVTLNHHTLLRMCTLSFSLAVAGVLTSACFLRNVSVSVAKVKYTSSSTSSRSSSRSRRNYNCFESILNSTLADPIRFLALSVHSLASPDSPSRTLVIYPPSLTVKTTECNLNSKS